MNFSFGQTEEEQVTVDVSGYDSTQVGETNRLTSKCFVRTVAFYKTAEVVILSNELAYFVSQLRMLSETLSGSAELNATGRQMQLRVVGNGNGAVALSGFVSDLPIIGRRHTFSLQFDQVRLTNAIAQLDRLMSVLRIPKALPDIKAEVDRLAAKIGAAGHGALPVYNKNAISYDGYYVEVDSRRYRFFYMERGCTTDILATAELDDLLFHIFKNVTSSLASDYELKHRIESQDSRRLWFKKWVELLSQLSPRWAEIQAEELRETLKNSPFDDSLR